MRNPTHTWLGWCLGSRCVLFASTFGTNACTEWCCSIARLFYANSVAQSHLQWYQ